MLKNRAESLPRNAFSAFSSMLNRNISDSLIPIRMRENAETFESMSDISISSSAVAELNSSRRRSKKRIRSRISKTNSESESESSLSHIYEHVPSSRNPDFVPSAPSRNSKGGMIFHLFVVK